MKINKNIKLSKFTSYKIGGPADYLTIVETEAELIDAIKFASKKNIPWVVLGKGSNVLVSDNGFSGLTIINKLCSFKILEDKLTIGSGYSLVAMVNKLARDGFSGFEGLCGIPGTVGAAIVGSAGAWGYEISDNLISIRVYDIKNKKVKNIKKNKIKFEYRKSNLENIIILSANFNLQKNDIEKIQEKIKLFIKKRIEKQPIGFSCGSFFKNPEGYSAGELIDKCGLKGLKIGGAIVSEKHGNFIINSDGAKAKDIIDISKIIKNKVKKEFKIVLEEEIKYIGF